MSGSWVIEEMELTLFGAISAAAYEVHGNMRKGEAGDEKKNMPFHQIKRT